MLNRCPADQRRRMMSAFAGFAHQLRRLAALDDTGSMAVRIATDELSVDVRVSDVHLEFVYRDLPSSRPSACIVCREMLGRASRDATRHLLHYMLLPDGTIQGLSHAAGARPIHLQDLITAAWLVSRAHRMVADYAVLAQGPSIL